MLAILERIRQVVAARLAAAKALIETYNNPTSDVPPEPSPDTTPKVTP